MIDEYNRPRNHKTGSSRNDHVFGERETWNLEERQQTEDNQGPYKGFLVVKCDTCGAVKAFCAKREIYAFKCDECGCETLLEKMRPLFLNCKCGAKWRYKTNLQDDTHVMMCLKCNQPVDIRLNRRKTAYVTASEKGVKHGK